MSTFDRLRSLLGQAPAGGESPLAALELAYRRQLEGLQLVRRDMVEAITSRKRLEAEAVRLAEANADLNVQAEQAAWAGRDEAARQLLLRALGVERRRASLQATIDRLRESSADIEATTQRLHDRVETFRLEVEALRARALASDAQARVWATERELTAQLEAAAAHVREARKTAEAAAGAAEAAGARESGAGPAGAAGRRSRPRRR